MTVKSQLVSRFASLKALQEDARVVELVLAGAACLLLTILFLLLTVVKIARVTFSFCVRHAMEPKPK